jgi:hypothetical protein
LPCVAEKKIIVDSPDQFKWGTHSWGDDAAAHPTASPTGTSTASVPSTVALIPAFLRSGSVRVIHVPAGAAAKIKALQAGIDA